MTTPSADRIAVYRFEIWDAEVGDNVWAPRMATLETIERLNGAAEIASERWVDRAAVDVNGYFPTQI